VLLNVLRGYTVQEALDAPRFCIDAEPIGEGKNARSKVFIEDAVPVEVAEKLQGQSWVANNLRNFHAKIF
jgi:gamma-glutamyltranspeptidase / glutathione hydrolase